MAGAETGEQSLRVEKVSLPSEESVEPQEGYLFTSRAHLQILAMGVLIPLDISMECLAHLDFSVRSFEFNMESAGTQISMSGKVQDDALHLVLNSAGSVTREEISLGQQPVFTAEAIYLALARKGFTVGSRKSFRVYDPMSTSLDTITAVVLKSEEITFGDDAVETYVLMLDFKGFEQKAWVDDKGICYQEESEVAGQKFVALRTLEDGTTVKRSLTDDVPDPDSGTDLLLSSFITVRVPLKDSFAIRRLVVALHNINPDDIPWSPPHLSQYTPSAEQLLDATGSVFAQVQSLSFEAYKPTTPIQHDRTPQWQQENRDFLAPSILIQSSHPVVQDKAREIVGDVTDEWEKVSRIADWIHRNILQEYRVTIPSAVEILQSLSGDCNEHSTLFAALCRAVSIPTKICSGIVYLEGSFGYHAWNEVLLPLPEGDQVWMPFDTTFRQRTVDATHIKLAEGGMDEQTLLVRIIGKLDLEVLEYGYE